MHASQAPVIVWFRQDLRLTDNPALTAAAQSGYPVLPVFIYDDTHAGEWEPGGASQWWLHHSLIALNKSLDGHLCVFRGDPQLTLPGLAEQVKAKAVYWNRCYEPWRIKRDTRIKQNLRSLDMEAKSFNGAVLFEPHLSCKKDGLPYKVFSPYYRHVSNHTDLTPRPPLPKPARISYYAHPSDPIESLGLIPSIPWYTSFEEHWTPGEEEALQRFSAFLKKGIVDYDEGRNYPDRDNVSRLSPHIHFGEISPHYIWYTAKEESRASQEDTHHFLREIGWREFAHNLLFHFPDLTRQNLQTKFDAFPWMDDPVSLKRWQKGETGYPIVDAGMRELWQTGYMHNRVRMIVGSFLVKNLLLHWHHGENWFWDTLLDADLANNTISWQWIAGTGADAAPYFRIFNPVTQSKKFDKEGAYIRRFVPELSKLPNKFIHNPWEAPKEILAHCEVVLGQTYPEPIVDLKTSRQRALDAFSSLS